MVPHNDDTTMQPRRSALFSELDWANGFGFGSHLRRMDRLMHGMMSDMGAGFASMDDGFGIGLGSMGKELDAMMKDQAELGKDGGKGAKSMSYSYSSSYSSSTSPDGRTSFKESKREMRNVDGVREGASLYRDSEGRERRALHRGLGEQMRELAQERDEKGHEKQVENLQQLEPDQVFSFDRAWEDARHQVDPKGRVLGRADPLAIGAGIESAAPMMRSLTSGSSSCAAPRSPEWSDAEDRRRVREARSRGAAAAGRSHAQPRAQLAH